MPRGAPPLLEGLLRLDAGASSSRDLVTIPLVPFAQLLDKLSSLLRALLEKIVFCYQRFAPYTLWILVVRGVAAGILSKPGVKVAFIPLRVPHILKNTNTGGHSKVYS